MKVYYLLNDHEGYFFGILMRKSADGDLTSCPTLGTSNSYLLVVLTGIRLASPILTNDGDFTDKMIHLRNEIDEFYLACQGIATKERTFVLIN